MDSHEPILIKHRVINNLRVGRYRKAELLHLELNTCMHKIFLPIGTAHYDSWRSHRLFSACRTFALHIDPDMTAQAVYEDHQRQGWTFFLKTEAARDRLAWFHSQLAPVAQAEQPSQYHPVEVGVHDAAIAIHTS